MGSAPRFPLRRALILINALLALSGCAETPPPPVVHAPPPLLLHAVGHGAVRPDPAFTPNQLKLAAMRASRMDAYRALTEQLFGVRVFGGTTVSNMIANSDSYKAYVDGYVRGAQIIEQSPIRGDDYAYETFMQLTVGDDFYRAAATWTAQPHERGIGGNNYETRHYYFDR